MKAYKAFDNGAVEIYSTVVFAENCREAKKIAFETECCEDAQYIDVRVQRFPQADKLYRGLREIDWYDMNERKALVELGWSCFEPSFECETCDAKSICSHWSD